MNFSKQLIWLAAIITTPLAGCHLGLQQSRDDKLFAQAIANTSTAPSFVLVTIVDDNSAHRQIVCTQAPFLLYALHIEHEIPRSETGRRKVEKLALQNKERLFQFSNPTALENVKPRYSQEILEDVREKLSPYSNEELLAGFDLENGTLHHIYNTRSGTEYVAYRDAAAQVLLERGINAGVGCRAAYLWVGDN